MGVSNLGKLFTISRPRFYPYLFGTYLVGFTASASYKTDFLSLIFFITLLFFTFPANLFLYGINDLFDLDTDKYSLKKKGREFVGKLKNNRNLKIAVLVSFLSAIFVSLIQASAISSFIVLIFIILSYIYSASPIRLKAKPFLDFGANFLYVTPGLVGYFQNTNVFPPLGIIIAASFWAFAMHIFSAIPDIKADKKASLTTTAVLLGKNLSLILCFMLWSSVTLILIISKLPLMVAIISLIYPLLALSSLKLTKEKLIKVYWYFPIINLVVGFALFVFAAAKFI